MGAIGIWGDGTPELLADFLSHDGPGIVSPKEIKDSLEHIAQVGVLQVFQPLVRENSSKYFHHVISVNVDPPGNQEGT